MNRRAWIMLAVLAALWGSSYLFIKVSLDDLPPAWIVFVRTALATLVLMPIAITRGALAPLRGRIGSLAVVAAVQVVVPFLLIAAGEKHVASSLTGILISSVPIFTALLAMRFAHEERSQGWGAIGIAVGIVGVALLFGVDLGGDSTLLLGGAAILLAGFGYAIGALFLKRRFGGLPPVGIAAGTMALSALMTIPALPFALPSGAGLDTVGSMAGLGIGGTGLSFLVFYTLIAEVGPARASLVTYIAPGFAIVYGAVLLDESIGPATVAGLALILAGSYLAAEGRLPWRQRAVATPPEPAAVPADRAA